MALTRCPDMINIVYRYLHQDRTEDIRAPGGSEVFVWSRAELPEADAVVYFTEYSFQAAAARAAGSKPRILFITEPVVVHPPQYSRRCWEQFDAVISCNPLLAEESERFYYLPVTTHGSPYPRGHGVVGEPCSREQLEGRRNAICQIVGAKFSLLSAELYSTRKEIAVWFDRHSEIPLDVYGRPPMNVPNYRGTTPDKLATSQQYRYSLCLENCYHPRWTMGYLTEKIFDAMEASAIPIYQGCANVEDYVPADCFIDYRQFDGPADLERFLRALTLQDYLGYVDRIRAFLEAHRPTERYHCNRLYELVPRVVQEIPGRREAALPKDFIEAGASARDRVAFVASCALLRHPGLFGVLMKSARAVQQLPAKLKGEKRS